MRTFNDPNRVLSNETVCYCFTSFTEELVGYRAVIVHVMVGTNNVPTLQKNGV